MHQEYLPPEELQDSIKCFWYNRSEHQLELSSFEVLPDGYAEIIFYFGELYDAELKPLPSPFMVGLLNQPIRYMTKNRLEVIAIRCFPWTVFDLLGLPSNASKLAVFEHPLSTLQQPLQKCIQEGKIEDAMALLKAYFLSIHAQLSPDTMLYKAGIAMRKAKGIMPVAQIAEAAHATVRTLERKFKHSSGFTVKDVTSIMRFEQVRNQLWLYPESNIAGLAHDLGYTDQAHLIREFKRYSGTTPSTFAKNIKKEKLAMSDDFVAFVQS